jgi:hypothetical protein
VEKSGGCRELKARSEAYDAESFDLRFGRGGQQGQLQVDGSSQAGPKH